MGPGMRKTAKSLGSFFSWAAAFMLAVVVFLELGSRYYTCPSSGQTYPTSMICNRGIHPINQSKVGAVQGLILLRRMGFEPSRQDLDRAINLVKYADMEGLNGIDCGDGMIFVRDNLGVEGKYYVARHELEHELLNHGVDPWCSNPEYCATWRAAKVYPIGFLETILSSLYIASTAYPTVWCFLFGSWRIFRVFILGWG